MEYTLRRSNRAKKIRLSLADDGSLTLVLPRFVPEMAGRAFLLANQAWINKHRAKQALTISHYAETEFITGSTLVFFDQNFYTIKIIKSDSKNYFRLQHRVVELYIKVSEKHKSQTVKALVDDFYRAQARDYLTERSHFYAEQLGVKFKGLRIKNTKSRWGSCSSQNNLNYNWRIMLAPQQVINYLVIHEVCHLVQMNHSPQFWALVENLDPDFRIHKKWLRDNQHRLFSFLDSR
jgi:predicted metal-dependent hydrolase